MALIRTTGDLGEHRNPVRVSEVGLVESRGHRRLR
jgi:hypothetical protein